MAQTVMKLPSEVFVQELNPYTFDFQVCDCNKRNVKAKRFFNAGYFAVLAGGKTIPVGNLAIGGKIITQAKDNPDWINVAKKKLTTIYTTKDGKCGITKTDALDDDIMLYRNIKTAMSGIPIIIGGKYVPLEAIKAEGYFGGTPEEEYKDGELYDTWHGFLGIRHNKPVYIGMKCGFDSMCWALVALGVYDAVKIDGGGSFILYDEKLLKATGGNRRINTAGIFDEV